MNTSDNSSWETLADQPLDSRDSEILDRVAAMFADLDPVPNDLVDRLQFSISMHSMEFELAELVSTGSMLASTRAAEQTSAVKSLTFTSDSLTTMITISADGASLVRIDGWIAATPAATVELHQSDQVRIETADEDGRFVFDGIEHGLIRLIIRPVAEPPAPAVATPGFEV